MRNLSLISLSASLPKAVVSPSSSECPTKIKTPVTGCVQSGNVVPKNHGEEHVPGKDLKFAHIAGISAGSLNAVMVAMQQFPELEHLWKNVIAGNPNKIWTSDYVDENLKPKNDLFKRFLPKIGLLKGLGLLLSDKKKAKLGKEVLDKILEIKSFASNAPLAERLKELVDKDKIQDTSLRVGYVSLNSGQYHTVKHDDFDKNEQFQKAILASTAMPVIWEPVDEVKSKNAQGQTMIHQKLVDGGVRNVSPLGDIIDDINADDDPNTEYYVIIINNHNGALKPSEDKQYNFLDVAYRSLVDITLNEIFINDIREFTRINQMVHQVEQAKKANLIPEAFDFVNPSDKKVFRKFYYQIVQPKGFIGTTLDFSKAQIDARIDHGYEVAESVFGLIKTSVNGDELVSRNTGSINTSFSAPVDVQTLIPAAKSQAPDWKV